MIIKPGRLNVGPDHLSCIKSGEEPTNLEDRLLEAQLFSIKVVDDHFAVGNTERGGVNQYSFQLEH